jgi:hypothetical protein
LQQPHDDSAEVQLGSAEGTVFFDKVEEIDSDPAVTLLL